MMSRLVMFALLSVLILTGASAFVQRGWQVTHSATPSAEITRAQPAEIAASMYAWVTSSPETEIPALAKQISQQAPWLPSSSFRQASLDVAAWVKGVFHSDVADNAVAWVKETAHHISTSLTANRDSLPSVVAEPATPSPTVKPATPVAVAPPASAPVVSPVSPAPSVVTATAPAPIPSTTPPAVAKPTPVEVSSANSWSVSKEGCAIGGLAGTGASLVIGPAELAAWVTGTAALPATVRVFGTVIGAALITGCATGALVAPVVAK